jgi:UV DNA damage repair endonuclease
VQYSCKTKLRADGQAEVHVSSGEESEAVTKEEDGSEDEFVTERKEPVPKWEVEVLAENKAVWEQFCKQLRLEVGSLG